MITDLNKYDELQRVIKHRQGIVELLEEFSVLNHHEFKKVADEVVLELLSERKDCSEREINTAMEVIINSKTMYDFEKIFPDGIDKIRICTKRVANISDKIKDNIERTNFLTINSYTMINDCPERLKREIVNLDSAEYDKYDLLFACFLLTINLIDGERSFDYMFNDKISKMSSNIYLFIYLD